MSAHPLAAFQNAKQTAGRHIGTVLREARQMASANVDGDQQAVRLSAKRLREALDSLTKLLGAR